MGVKGGLSLPSMSDEKDDLINRLDIALRTMYVLVSDRAYNQQRKGWAIDGNKLLDDCDEILKMNGFSMKKDPYYQSEEFLREVEEELEKMAEEDILVRVEKE